MEETKLKVSILPNQFLKEDGVFDKDEALRMSGIIAGVCYDKEGFLHLVNEPSEKTNRRVNMALENGHHSVFDHIYINFNIQNIPKILAMVLNNEQEYSTSEKSARYTKVVRTNGSIITEKEENLYNKWLEIFKIKIKNEYGDIYSDAKIRKLAQENARYIVTVFMPTQMIYTTSLRQINYISSWMKNYIKNADMNNTFEKKLAVSMEELLLEFERVNVLVDGLMQNEKNRKLSLFGKDIDRNREYFGKYYETSYKGSFAQYAQIQRHRTIDYELEMMDQKEYYIPPIIMDDTLLVNEWLDDLNSVKELNPQGEIVKIHESGSYKNFIIKCKDRLCSSVQLETMRQTSETLKKYMSELELNNDALLEDLRKYSYGARCTFPDFNCPEDCKFKEGKILTRKI